MVFKQVALFAVSFCVKVSVNVEAVVCFLQSTVLVVTVPTHSASVVLCLGVGAVPNHSSRLSQNPFLLGFAVNSHDFEHQLSIVFYYLIKTCSRFWLILNRRIMKLWFGSVFLL